MTKYKEPKRCKKARLHALKLINDNIAPQQAKAIIKAWSNIPTGTLMSFLLEKAEEIKTKKRKKKMLKKIKGNSEKEI